VPGLLFVAKEFRCLKLDTCLGGGTWGPRLSTGAPSWTPPKSVEEIVPWRLLCRFFRVELICFGVRGVDPAVGPCSPPWPAAQLGTRRWLPPAGLLDLGVGGGVWSG
jgi:hypothetical protein